MRESHDFEGCARRELSALPQSWRDIAFSDASAVLLETTLPSEAERYSYLFLGTQEVLTAQTADDLPQLFSAIEDALSRGLYVAGWFAYEAAAHFFGDRHFKGCGPLAVLGVFPSPKVFDHLQPAAEETTLTSAALLPIAPFMKIDHAAYLADVEKIQQWIAAGDTYQVNLTSSMVSPYHGDAAAAYEALRLQQPCGYAAVVRLQPTQTVLSFSPELFFRIDSNGTITTKPMKGTAKRGDSAEEDARMEQLRSDEKNRAEHVMIVDLLRNDLGRVCTMGSVRVDELFAVEPYNKILQMTSTIRGTLPQGFLWYEIFQALFPCGSITGAPKPHTIDLIGQVEAEPRGVYTGAIGYFAPDRTACFNVAIRTAVLEEGSLTLGIGGGIVADSVPEDEYAECMLKAGFLERASEPLALIETMRWHDGECALLDRHMARLLSSAEALGIVVEADAIRRLIRKESAPWRSGTQRVRLTLDRNGALSLGAVEAPVWRQGLQLCLASRQTRSDAPHLRHKTTFRPEYDVEFRAAVDAGYDEAIFLNQRGELTEGCIASLLICGSGRWYTPPLNAGVLPGVYRSHLLDRGVIEERRITLQDMKNADSVAICNAVRGIGYVASLTLPGGSPLRWPDVPGANRLPA